MNVFLEEIQQTLFPRHDGKDGPLTPLLLALTIVTGLVDSFSYLVLGHVFVANMTGNVVFLAFALAGAKGFSIVSSLLAIVAFLVGSLAGGALISRMGSNRGRLFSASTILQVLLVGIAAIVTLFSPNPVPSTFGYVLIAILAITLGIQNTAVRKLGVPDLTTTVLTLTITGIGADSRIVGGSGSKAGRRLLSIAAMFLGAFIGTLLILYVSIGYPLLIVSAITVVVASLARVFSRGNPAWVSPK
jgi:uncharacterized membrane protein YoaK (UPF0700 family)